MKKTILFTGLLLMHVIGFASALNPKNQASVYNHLVEVNQQWKSRSAFVSHEQVHFSTDIDRIQFHLLQVEKLLRTSNLGNLDKNQLKNRLAMLDVLHYYAMNRDFPINSYHPERKPYFIDVNGTHCAVGYLVKISGYGEVSKAISRTQNYAYVKEIQSSELLDWSRKFGFSVDELALIQPTYGPTESYEQIQQGTNGNVTLMRNVYDSPTQSESIYLSGEFTSLNNLPCLNIGKYVNNQLSCLGDGIDGKIVEISAEVGHILAVGEFNFNGSVYPMAIFDGDSWYYEVIPARPNARATAYKRTNMPGISRKIAINHPTDPNKQEIWEQKNGVWDLYATVNGTVYVIHDNALGAYAGAFDLFTLNTTPPTVFECKNLLISSNNGNEWTTIDEHVSDTIFTIYAENEMLFVGGSGSTLPNRSHVSLSRYLNGACQPLVLADQFDNGSCVIRDIDYFDQSNIVLAGKFSNYATGAMYLGKHVMKIDKATNYMVFMSDLNKPVHAIGRTSTAFYFGGEFTQDFSGNELKHLVKLKSFVGLDEVEKEASFQIFPNPSSGMIQVTGNENIKSIAISDLQGKKWLEKTSATQKIDGSELPSGVYLVRIESEKGNSQTVKWMKN